MCGVEEEEGKKMWCYWKLLFNNVDPFSFLCEQNWGLWIDMGREERKKVRGGKERRDTELGKRTAKQ